MRATGRDRFNLEKMRIHSENLFSYYNDFIVPVIKPYISQCIFQSSSYFYEMLLRFCELYCHQVYFPFDEHTRLLFESMCTIIVEKTSTSERFLSTSFDMELISLSIIIMIILLHSINDRLLDDFIQHLYKERKQFFSYSLWLKNLNALIYLESVRYYQFYGRKSILMEAITDNHSKLRYMKYLIKIFDQNIEANNDKVLEQIHEQEKQIRQILIENSKPGSLVYAMKTKEFFSEEFQNLSSSKLLTFSLSFKSIQTNKLEYQCCLFYCSMVLNLIV